MKIIKLIFSALMLSVFAPVTITYALTNETVKDKHVVQQYGKNSERSHEGELLGWLIVLDKNEISVAHEALKRHLNPKVKRYAQLLIKQHSQNIKETLKAGHEMGLRPIKGPAAMALKQKGKHMLAQLKNMDDQEFQEAYIKGMIKGHKQALEAIKKDLKNAHNPDLKKLLVASEKDVQLHLLKAQRLQKKLYSSH